MAHNRLTCHISECLCAYSNSASLEMPEIWSWSNVIFCVRVAAVIVVCVSMLQPHSEPELSPSPGCNSDWLNLPGKFRRWLEAPSNYLTVDKTDVKNRFSCSVMSPFCSREQMCCLKNCAAYALKMCHLGPPLCSPSTRNLFILESFLWVFLHEGGLSLT